MCHLLPDLVLVLQALRSQVPRVDGHTADLLGEMSDKKMNVEAFGMLDSFHPKLDELEGCFFHLVSL